MGASCSEEKKKNPDLSLCPGDGHTPECCPQRAAAVAQQRQSPKVTGGKTASLLSRLQAEQTAGGLSAPQKHPEKTWGNVSM